MAVLHVEPHHLLKSLYCVSEVIMGKTPPSFALMTGKKTDRVVKATNHAK